MNEDGKCAVTGAFGFSGRHITRRLLDAGQKVITLTGHPRTDKEFGEKVKAYPFNFDKPDELEKTLQGVQTLYNTYWVRFSHGQTTFEKAVANSKALFGAASRAGVKRLVHVSITNPDGNPDLPYFAGKAELEQTIRESGLSYGILRPAVIFGDQGILINNIAWFLRHLPVFVVPGSGEYSLQPIHADDLADLAVSLGAGTENAIVDAVGPEAYTFNELLRLIARTVRRRPMVLHMPPLISLQMVRMLGFLVHDVVLTRDEIIGLMRDLLVSKEPPTGKIRLSEWLQEHSGETGRKYMSELRKHY